MSEWYDTVIENKKVQRYESKPPNSEENDDNNDKLGYLSERREFFSTYFDREFYQKYGVKHINRIRN